MRLARLRRARCRHRLPGLSPDPDDDGARKRRAPARARRPTRRVRRRRSGSRGGRPRSSSDPLSGPAVGGRAAARGDRPRLHRRPETACSPTSRPEISTPPPGALVIDCLFEHQARHGTTLLLITHDPSVAERCERQIHLLDGRIVEDRRTPRLRVGSRAARPLSAGTGPSGLPARPPRAARRHPRPARLSRLPRARGDARSPASARSPLRLSPASRPTRASCSAATPRLGSPTAGRCGRATHTSREAERCPKSPRCGRWRARSTATGEV